MSRIPLTISVLAINEASHFSSDLTPTTIIPNHNISYGSPLSVTQVTLEGEGYVEANPSDVANDHHARVRYLWEFWFGAWFVVAQLDSYAEIPSINGRAKGVVRGFQHWEEREGSINHRIRVLVDPVSPAPASDFIYHTPVESGSGQLDYNVFQVVRWRS